MALPLILIVTALASWLLILSLIAGLCLSARQGDLQQHEATATPHSGDRIEPPLFSARITAQQGRRAYPCNPAGVTTSATG